MGGTERDGAGGGGTLLFALLGDDLDGTRRAILVAPEGYGRTIAASRTVLAFAREQFGAEAERLRKQSNEQAQSVHDLRDMVSNAATLLSNIAAALGTDATGDALVDVARKAHEAEKELATIPAAHTATSPPTEAEIERVMWRLLSAALEHDAPPVALWKSETKQYWRRGALAAFAEIQRSAAPSVPAELLAMLPDRKKLILSPEQVSAVWELIAWARTLPASPLPADVVKQAREIAARFDAECEQLGQFSVLLIYTMDNLIRRIAEMAP